MMLRDITAGIVLFFSSSIFLPPLATLSVANPVCMKLHFSYAAIQYHGVNQIKYENYIPSIVCMNIADNCWQNVFVTTRQVLQVNS